MALIEWSDSLALGVGAMDDTHREFVDQLNVLQLSYVLKDGALVADPSANLDTLRAATVRMRAEKEERDGLTPQAEFSTEVRIRNLGITGEPVT